MPANSLAGPFLEMQPAEGSVGYHVVVNPIPAEIMIRLLTLFP